MTSLDLAQASLSGDYRRQAVYFADSDCVEFVKDDAFTIYHRVDDFLTLITDETKIGIVGFKLKGFRHYFNEIKAKHQLTAAHFVLLVEVIEAHCTDIGEQLFTNDFRQRAYKAAGQFAKEHNARLDSHEFDQAMAA